MADAQLILRVSPAAGLRQLIHKIDYTVFLFLGDKELSRAKKSVHLMIIRNCFFRRDHLVKAQSFDHGSVFLLPRVRNLTSPPCSLRIRDSKQRLTAESQQSPLIQRAFAFLEVG